MLESWGLMGGDNSNEGPGKQSAVTVMGEGFFMGMRVLSCG